MNENDWPACSAETATLLRNFDWAATALGPIAHWPTSLRAIVDVVLHAPVAMALVWGEDGIMIYNDAYAFLAGGKHPRAFGAPVRLAWPETWDFNSAMLRDCHAGEVKVYRGQHFVLDRAGRPDDAWFDLYYSPVRGERMEVAGVLCTVIETTASVREQQRRIEHEAQLEQANRQLARDMGFLNALFQQAPSFMAVLLGPEHVFELANASYIRLVQREGIIGKPVALALPEAARQGFVALLDEVYRSGTPYYGKRIEVMLDTGAGTPVRRILDFVYQPLKDDRGATYGVFVEGIDVTALSLAEERLRVAQDAGEIGTFEWYPPTGELDVSDTFRRIWGFDAATRVTSALLLGQIAAEHRHLAGAHRIGALANPLEYAEYQITRADTGEQRWLARRGQPVGQNADGQPRYLGVVFDITERKRIEASLRASEKRLGTVFAQASVGLSELDLDGRFVRVNDALCRMLGRSQAALLGVHFATVTHPDDRALNLEAARELILHGGSAAIEKRYLRPDGSHLWALTSVTRIVDDHGQPQSLIAVTTDLTERRKVEQTLRDMNESLERKVAREVGERVKAEEALRQAQKMEAVGQLASGVAHDFNNVLQIISSNLQLIELEGGAGAPSGARVASAIAAVERGSKLSSQLLAFARRQPLQPVATHLGRLLADMEQLMQRALGELVAVEIDVADGLWPVSVDRNQLENAILNMAINARDAMQGSGRLRFRLANVVLGGAHASLAPGQYVSLALTDTGCGMPPEVIAKVFDPFYTTKEPGKGTGLGMSMVYGFVKQSGGEIRIDSHPGDGTTITIHLPRAFVAEAAIAPSVRASVTGGDETVLVVEDDPAVRAATTDILSSLGYRTLKAENGAQALAILNSGAPVDLLFTDVFMPGAVDSTELVEQARVVAPGTAILLASGHALDSPPPGRRIPPGVALLGKPYSREQLARKIRHELSRKAGAAAPLPTAQPASATALRFLVVEDDADAKELACEMLRVLGHAAQGAGSAEQALELLPAGRFDVLFTDLNLPGMAGDALAARACRSAPGLKVILASGEGKVPFAAEGCAAVVLPKPYDLMQLQAGIDELAHSRQAQAS